MATKRKIVVVYKEVKTVYESDIQTFKELLSLTDISGSFDIANTSAIDNNGLSYELDEAPLPKDDFSMFFVSKKVENGSQETIKDKIQNALIGFKNELKDELDDIDYDILSSSVDILKIKINSVINKYFNSLEKEQNITKDKNIENEELTSNKELREDEDIKKYHNIQDAINKIYPNE